jgi:hypothetical protein
MSADDGRMQEETMKAALAVVTAMLSDDDKLTRATVAGISKELLDADAHNHARLYVYVHQAAQLTELALGIAALASEKSMEEIHEALAGAIASTDWSDNAYGGCE